MNTVNFGVFFARKYAAVMHDSRALLIAPRGGTLGGDAIRPYENPQPHRPGLSRIWSWTDRA
jgi:hypothetical protein